MDETIKKKLLNKWPLRNYHQPLYDAIKFKAGPQNYSNKFFEGTSDRAISNINSSVGLVAYDTFKIKSISLLPSFKTRYYDFKSLIACCHFQFIIGSTVVLEGPAQMIASPDINQLHRVLEAYVSGKSNKGRKLIDELQSYFSKPSNGFVLNNNIEILSLQSFRLSLYLKEPCSLKRDVEVLCILDGELIRGITG